jgi:hypothetical protein
MQSNILSTNQLINVGFILKIGFSDKFSLLSFDQAI